MSQKEEDKVVERNKRQIQGCLFVGGIVLVFLVLIIANTRVKESKMALITAIENRNLETVAELLKRGVVPDDQRNPIWDQETALMTACRCQEPEMVRLLLKYGADVNGRDERENTPLHIACLEGNTEIVQILLKAGADVNSIDDCRQNALFVTRSPEVAQVLIDNGIDINAPNSFSSTPLHYCWEEEAYDVLKVLLENHADINLVDASGATPLHVMCKHSDSIEGARLLIKYGAKVNAIDSNGSTPLMEAVSPMWRMGPRSDLIKLLLENGADRTMKLDNGLSAADILKREYALEKEDNKEQWEEENMEMVYKEVFELLD